MRRALDLAAEAAEAGEVPVGAVVSRGEEIVAEARNAMRGSLDPTAHAEVVAIRIACEALGSFQLAGCELYTSCEPCPMCLGAIYWARPAAIYYAGTHKDAASAGFDDSFIYQQTRLPVNDRHIPMRRLLPEQGGQPFAAWLSKANRIPY